MKQANLHSWKNIKHWHKVIVSGNQTVEIYNEIRVWAMKNGTDKSYVRAWNEYRFEDEQDAVLFALKWS